MKLTNILSSEPTDVSRAERALEDARNGLLSAVNAAEGHEVMAAYERSSAEMLRLRIARLEAYLAQRNKVAA